MQITTILGYHFSPISGQNLPSMTTHSVGKAVEKQAFLCTAGGNVNWHNPCRGEFGNS